MMMPHRKEEAEQQTGAFVTGTPAEKHTKAHAPVAGRFDAAGPNGFSRALCHPGIPRDGARNEGCNRRRAALLVFSCFLPENRFTLFRKHFRQSA